MKLSRKGEYALRALICLGLGEAFGRKQLRVAEISSSDNIPEKFLEQIMNDLRDGGFVEGLRGRNGGYRLTRPAEQISLGQIIRHIEGPLAPIACASHTAYERCSCPDEANCGLRMLMLDVRNAISDILDRHTLSSVVQVAHRKYLATGRRPAFAGGEEGFDNTGKGRLTDGLLANLLPDYFI
ncbi:MAG: Rrf2 family transcriptional regulator [Opitutales bacterium]|nr:Rrf2 family transcriptional regulator [Opitutales bacterium]